MCLASFVFVQHILCNIDTVRIIHTTDIHGWIGGHPHDKAHSGNLGDLYNFVIHQKEQAKSNEFVVMFDTGDFVQGTAYSDATHPAGTFIMSCLKMLPYDALTLGNHDVRHSEIVDAIANDFTPHWNGTLLGAQCVYSGKRKLTDLYTVIPLPNHAGNILVFGWIYYFDKTASNIELTPWDDYIKDPRFLSAFETPNIKLVVNLCHISTISSLVTKLEKFVANSLPDVPQVSLTGHTHLQFTKSSDNRYTMESGSYLKTVGVLDVKLGKKKASFKQESVEFNIQNLSSFCGISESKWETAGGAYIKQTIAAKAEELNLAHIIGYAQTEYSMTPKLTSRSKNVYGLMVEKVLPELGPHTKGQLQSTTNRPVYFLDILLVREKIYKGPVNVFDLYACDPFNYEFYGYANVSGTHLKKVINMLLPPPEDDLDSDPFVPTRIYYYWTDTSIKSDQFYDVYLVATNENDLRKRFEKVAPGKYKIHKTSVFYRDCLAEYIESHWN